MKKSLHSNILIVYLIFTHPLIAQEFELSLYESKKKVTLAKVTWNASILQEDSGSKDVHWTKKDVVKNITGLQVTLRPGFKSLILKIDQKPTLGTSQVLHNQDFLNYLIVWNALRQSHQPISRTSKIAFLMD